jgi:hypothetical protein
VGLQALCEAENGFYTASSFPRPNPHRLRARWDSDRNMAQSEQNEAATGELPPHLGSAADEFRFTVERQVREIVETAEDRAAAIEREAEARARQIELAEENARELREKTAEKAAQLLEGIEFLEHGLAMLRELREEMEGLAPGPVGDRRAEAPEAEGAAEGPAERSEPVETAGEAAADEPGPDEAPAPDPLEASDAGDDDGNHLYDYERDGEGDRGSEHEYDPSAPGDEAQLEAPSGEREATSQAEEQIPDPEHDVNGGFSRPAAEGAEETELNAMVREQIVRMHEQGKSRAEVERLLMRFKLGESYISMLDQIYQEGPEHELSKRRLFGRRRRET